MNFTASIQHDKAMRDMETQVDFSMLQVIRISRQLSEYLNNTGIRSGSVDLLAKQLKEALAECDRVRLEWLKEATKRWTQA